MLLPFSFLFLLTGCGDTQKFIDRMKLSNEEAVKVKPVIEEYLKKQSEIFEIIKKYKKPSGGTGGDSTDRSAMKDDMEKQKEEIGSFFESNDNDAMKELKPLVTEEQLNVFLNTAKEYRQEKIKEMMGGTGSTERHEGRGRHK